jgi:hypothetical protein
MPLPGRVIGASRSGASTGGMGRVHF